MKAFDSWLEKHLVSARILILVFNGLLLSYFLWSLLTMRFKEPVFLGALAGLGSIFWGLISAVPQGYLEITFPSKTVMNAMWFVIQYLLSYSGIVIGFALVYSAFGLNGVAPGIEHDAHGYIHDPRCCLYFSIMTITTVGYGDFTPSYDAMVWTAVEATLGFVLFGVFIGCITGFMKSIGDVMFSNLKRTEAKLNSQLVNLEDQIAKLQELIDRKPKKEHLMQ